MQGHCHAGIVGPFSGNQAVWPAASVTAHDGKAAQRPELDRRPSASEVESQEGFYVDELLTV